jgi:hypothetical protein
MKLVCEIENTFWAKPSTLVLQFCQELRQVSFLGHIVSTEGISADPTKIESVKAWPSPKTITDVRSFMGTSLYYREML